MPSVPATSSFSRFLLVTLCFCVSLALCAPKGVLVPFYVDPYAYPEDWSRLKQSAQNHTNLQFIAVINLANGPGSAQDSTYLAQLSSGVPSNLRFVGYVHSMATIEYTAFRNISLVKQDVDNWYSWYSNHLSGIFVDEVPNRWPSSSLGTRAVQVAYYQQLYNYIKTKQSNSTVILNPGSPYWEELIESSTPAGDIAVLFESKTDTWTGNATNQCQLWSYAQPPFGPGPFCSYVRNWDGVDTLKADVEGGTIPANKTAALLYGSTATGLNATQITSRVLNYGTGVYWYYIADLNCGAPDWANCWGRLTTSAIWNGLLSALNIA